MASRCGPHAGLEDIGPHSRPEPGKAQIINQEPTLGRFGNRRISKLDACHRTAMLEAKNQHWQASRQESEGCSRLLRLVNATPLKRHSLNIIYIMRSFVWEMRHARPQKSPGKPDASFARFYRLFRLGCSDPSFTPVSLANSGGSDSVSPDWVHSDRRRPLMSRFTVCRHLSKKPGVRAAAYVLARRRAWPPFVAKLARP